MDLKTSMMKVAQYRLTLTYSDILHGPQNLDGEGGPVPAGLNLL